MSAFSLTLRDKVSPRLMKLSFYLMDFVMYCHDNKIYIIEQTKNAKKIIENATEQGKDNEMGFITQKTRKILSNPTLYQITQL